MAPISHRLVLPRPAGDDAKIVVMDGDDHMQPVSATKLTYEDFLGFPDDGQRHELIDGVHFVTPSPATKHQRVSGRLFACLFNYLRLHPIGEVFSAPFDVVLSNHDVVEPDLLVVLADQSAIVTDQHVRGAPALVIEILSPGTRRTDEGAKSRLYDRVGVREYWLVDPVRDVIVVRRRSPDGPLAPTAEWSRQEGSAAGSPLLPGLSLPLEELFQ
jgi:Uma2 family endonuclease